MSRAHISANKSIGASNYCFHIFSLLLTPSIPPFLLTPSIPSFNSLRFNQKELETESNRIWRSVIVVMVIVAMVIVFMVIGYGDGHGSALNRGPSFSDPTNWTLKSSFVKQT